eukprot:gene7895-12363_t
MSSTPIRSRSKKVQPKKRKADESTEVEIPFKKPKTKNETTEVEKQIFSILAPATIKKIKENEKILINNKLLDEKLTLKLQYNQLDRTLRIIRDLYKEKKRTAMYKDELIIQILNLSPIKKNKKIIIEELDLILKILPDWCFTFKTPSSGKLVFEIKDFKVPNINEKIKNLEKENK